MKPNGSHTGGNIRLEYRQDTDGRARVEDALKRLKDSSTKPGYRSIEVTYFNGRFRVTPRQTWDWEADT